MKQEKSMFKIQELVHELKVGDVMTRNVITVTPGSMMSDLSMLLRDNRISGSPVIEGEKLVGVISVENFINWLAEGSNDCPVSDKMTSKVYTLYGDESLAHAVSKLDEHGFGRFPVINRSGKLVGVITKGDIIEGLLKKLEIEYHEEEILHYRTSHFFEDIVADETSLTFGYHIDRKSVEEGGTVASGLKKTLRRLDINPGIVRRAAIATYEAEMNIIIYAREGEITATVDPDRVLIDARDRGPGISDIDKAMQPGFSTAPNWVRELGFGAGMGLNNIKNCAESLDITSAPNQGTRLKISISMVI